MGLGPSHNPTCRVCDFQYGVTYIYNDTESGIPKLSGLERWWNCHKIYDCRSIYWACENCIDSIPIEYRDKFEYIENYTVRGM